MNEPSLLVGKVESKQNIRNAGWWIFGLGNAIGLGMMAAGADTDGEGLDEGLVLAGTTVALSSMVLALILVLVKDEAKIEVSPMSF